MPRRVKVTLRCYEGKVKSPEGNWEDSGTFRTLAEALAWKADAKKGGKVKLTPRYHRA